MDYESFTKEELIEVLKRRDSLSRYGLRWERERITPDKRLNRDFVGLELQAELSAGAAPWQNLIIEGDNYDALRHLATTHAGQFHLVTIDPPFNTGRRDFVYNDSFFDATHRYRHSTWLEFMYQRLVLAKHLLREDGSIFISIDDNELPNLWLLLNQVFGEKAFVANNVWQKRYSRDNTSAIGDSHEYVIVFAPNPAAFKKRRGRLPLDEKSRRPYRNTNGDTRGAWRTVPMHGAGLRPNQQYRIQLPSGRWVEPPEGRHWAVLEPEYLRLKAAGKVYFGANGDAMPGVIRYLDEVDGLTPWTWWPHEEAGHTDEAKKEIQEIFGTQMAFDTPKPLRLLERILRIGAPEKDALVLDFFAGSGTLGHAVLKMNREEGADRRFVLVSNTEATLDNPDKNLCRDVCAVRVRKAVEGYTPERGGAAVPGLGGNFAYLKAKTVPMHRLEEGLTDSMIWAFAQQTCGHPLTVVARSLSVSTHGDHLVAYCANVKPATLQQLKLEIASHHGNGVVLCWAPQAVLDGLGELASRIQLVALPGDLRRAFKQGNARAADPVEIPAIEEPAELAQPQEFASAK